jgi:hypothetical protein
MAHIEAALVLVDEEIKELAMKMAVHLVAISKLKVWIPKNTTTILYNTV